MRGSPLVRAMLAVIALLALLIPLRTLTSRRTETTTSLQQAAQGSTAKKKFRLELTSTTVPFKYQITIGGEPIWSGESDSTAVAADGERKFSPGRITVARDAPSVETKQASVKPARVSRAPPLM